MKNLSEKIEKENYSISQNSKMISENWEQEINNLKIDKFESSKMHSNESNYHPVMSGKPIFLIS